MKSINLLILCLVFVLATGCGTGGSTPTSTTNQPANGTIISPLGNVTINVGGSVYFAGEGTDPENDLPLTCYWTFGAGSGVSPSSQKDPGLIQFNNPGVYTVALTVTDALGHVSPTPATLTITVSNVSENQPANGTISSPLGNVAINAGDSVYFTGEGADPENDLPLTYLWTFGAGSGVPASSQKAPGQIQFNNAGVYTVIMTVTDALGHADPTPATLTITVSNVSVNQPANGTISSPPGNVTINVGGSVYLPAGTDPENDLPLTYYWTFGAGSGVSPSSQKDPGLIQFNNPGVYTVALTVTDALGHADPTPATLTITVSNVSVNQPANGTISSPLGNVTINAGDSVYFTGEGTDPENDLPLTYLWTFGAGSGVPPSSQKDPGLIQFNSPGVYTVALAVTDALGHADPTPATLTVTVATPVAAVISQANWSIKFVDSQELVGEDGSAVNAIDGNPTTLWHTDWYVYSPTPPHELQIDLGGLYRISGFRYLPRQDGIKAGWVTQYEVFVSIDGVNWGNPVAAGTFAGNATEKQVTFAPVRGQFTRFRSLSNDANGEPWASAAEIGVVGVPVKPSLRIVKPLDHHLQTGTDLLARANAFLDNTAHNGWGVRFLLDGGPSNGGRSFDVYSPPFETIFTACGKAEHVVDAVLIDNSGREVSMSDTRDQSIRVGIGNFYVAMGDSITAAYPTGGGDDFPADDTSLDGRNTGGGYVPILNNLLTAKQSTPFTIVNHGFGGTTSAYGVSLIPVLLKKYPDAQRYLILYGMNDAQPLLAVPSGKGLSPGDPGYPGSFKDNMQRMVNAVKWAGKAPTLAKINIAVGDYLGPYPNPDTGARSVLIKEYNLVIDELVGNPANNITVQPPDFYTYFAQHYQLEYIDYIHPNGVGYQSMGRLWCEALTGAPCGGQ